MDGNAQNMYHGNHQGDPYYRYDPAAASAAAAASAPRAMGPPGGYPPRHRAPHPLQQHPQYPSYQPSPENIYGLGANDQHVGMGGMGDLSGWGAPTPQPGPYPTAGLGAYGHPQAAPPTQQRQTTAQSYRQHMPSYGQQDQQKLPYGAQQGMISSLLPQAGPAGYGALAQQQQQQQQNQQPPTPNAQQQQQQQQTQQQQSQQSRLPQHYPQPVGQHPLYAVPQTQAGQPGAPQAYAHSPYGSPMQHQPGRGAQHVGYGHAGLDQANPYVQHISSSAAPPGSVPTHHLNAQQQQAAQLGAHPGSTHGQQQQQQPTPGLHGSHNVNSQAQSLPPGLSGVPQQQQQQTSHLLQSQQQQQQQQQQQPPNHVSLHHQATSQHSQMPSAAGLPPSHAMNVPPGYGSHPQQQQQQQPASQQQAQAPPYMTASKHQPTSVAQYRAPFPQLSPQMSPRPPTMSPHPQMSPRPPGMSPAKPPPQTAQVQQQQQQINSPNQQPPTHHSISGLVGLTSPRQQPPPTSVGSQSNNKSGPGGGPPPVNTLQALEQMVMPGSQGPVMGGPAGMPMDYPSAYRQPSHTPMSPMGPRMPVSPQHHQQWPPHHPMSSMQQQTTPSQQNSNPMSVGNMTAPPTSQMQQQQQQQHQQQMSMYVQSMSHQQQHAPPQPQQQQQQPPTSHAPTALTGPSPPAQQQQQIQQQHQHQHQQQQQHQQQLSEQLQHSINDIVGGGNSTHNAQHQQQQQTHQHQLSPHLTSLAPMSTMQSQPQQQPPPPTSMSMHQMSHTQPPPSLQQHQMSLPTTVAGGDTSTTIMARTTPTSAEQQLPPSVSIASPHHAQVVQAQATTQQQQSQQQSPHQGQQQHQQHQAAYGQPQAQHQPSQNLSQQQQQHSLMAESYSPMMPAANAVPQTSTEPQKQQATVHQQQPQPPPVSTPATMSPAHASSPLATMSNSSSTSQSALQLQQQPTTATNSMPQLQQQPLTPSSTPSHQLSSILNETANSNDSSTLAVAANDSNNSSSNSSTNSIVNNQPTSVHDSNSQSSINSNNQQPLSGLENAMMNSNSNSAINAGSGLLDSAGASLFDQNSMSSTGAAVAAVSTAASAAAAMLDSNSQSSFVGGADFEVSSVKQQIDQTNEESLANLDNSSQNDEEMNTDTNIKQTEVTEPEKVAATDETDNATTASQIEDIKVSSPPPEETLDKTTKILSQNLEEDQTIPELEMESKPPIASTGGTPPVITELPQHIDAVQPLVDPITQIVPPAITTAIPLPPTQLTPPTAQQQQMPASILPVPQQPGLTAAPPPHPHPLGAMTTAGMPPTMMPPPPYAAGMYPPYPMLHQQEIAALQQQIQEMYCMPPGHDHQEKIMRMQERLNILQQHEINEQCAGGGPQCLLYQSMPPPPLYGSSAMHHQMIESPQVSSTTGRGRGKGAAKPRKPRNKKGEKGQPTSDLMDISGNVVVSATTLPPTQLPVSEDCVTQGAGDTSVVGSLEYNESGADISQDVHSANELDTSTDGTGKKKKPRKPRTPKDPNKPPRERTTKSRKPKNPNDPNSTESPPRRRSVPKKKKLIIGGADILAAEDAEKAEGSEIEDNKPLISRAADDGEQSSSIGAAKSDEEKPETTTLESTGGTVDTDAPDYDDIPVSKIPTTRTSGDDEKTAEAAGGDETIDSVPDSAGDVNKTPSRRKNSRSRGRRSGGGGTAGDSNEGDGSSSKRRRANLSAKALKKRRNRGRIVPESDGEDDTLASTPPPSPPPDSENDSNKRRSSRNTQRKKYIDDVMLRFSDDDSSLIGGTSPVKRERKSATSSAAAAAAAALAASTTVSSAAGSDTEKAEASAENSVAEGDTATNSDDKPLVEANDDSSMHGEASSSTNVASDKEKSFATTTTTEQPAPISAKPNYVYINTGDEDSMVVQYVLAVRMGRRELIPEPPPAPPKPIKTEEENLKEATEDEKATDKDTDPDAEKIEKTETSAEDEAELASEKKKESEEKNEQDPTAETKPVSDEKSEVATDEQKEEEEVLEDKEKIISQDSKEVETTAEKNIADVTEESDKNKTDKMEVDQADIEGPEVKTNENGVAKKEEEESKAERADDKTETDEKIEEVVDKEEEPAETVSNAVEKMEVDVNDESLPKSQTSKTEEEEKKMEVEVEKETERKSEVSEDANENDDTEAENKKETIDTTETDGAKSKEPDTEDEESKAIEEVTAKPEPVFIDVEEYFVKYRNFSYLHCEWRTEEELFKGDRRVGAKIRRFQQKQAQQMNIFENLEEEPFNPDFVEVDRVLDMSVHTDENTGETTKHYLVKWKSLAYEDCTWELEEDVDDDKIEQYLRFNKVPPRNEWKSRKRPHPDQWKKLDETPVYKNSNTLRPYQLEGLNWLKFSWYNSHNCILADEMGLGKTIQSLTFVHSVYEYGIRGPFLVIAPLSTIPNWQREFEGWTDMNVVVYHGSVTSKQMIQDYEFFYKTESGKVLKEPVKFNVLITTFEMIVTDHMDLKAFNWRLCVIDEAHRLKNRNCKLLEGLRQLNLEHRVLLSGTPLQNNISELFSLLNFLEPNQFSSAEEFMSEFGSLRTEEEVNKLQALLKPMMLRRLKDDVEKSLAPKEETIIEVELTNIQKKYYRGILEQNFSFLKKGTTSANIPNLMNTMMELRKCCIHPYLLNGAEEQIQYDYRQQHGEDAESYYKNLIQSAGKMVLIDKLLPKLKANGHRVLIFSQMVRCLDILEDYLVYRKYPFERIDGRIRGNLRQEAIDRYSKPGSDRFVFLLCTKAGGLGINLTAADTVIIYDSDWNPQNDLQAQARCHRIGQRKMVKIYRLLCRNTYEREMFDKASLKLGLDKAVLQSMNTQNSKDGSNKQLSKKEIEDLLRKGAYGAVMDDDNAGDKFCEEDIDSILKRRTQVITMEAEKGSTFSKASFAASGNRSDITIDDPDFWTKWAKRADIDPDACERDETEDLVLSEPRRRTQIKRYGHEDVMEINSDNSSNDNSDEEGGISLRSRRRKEKRDRGREKKTNDEYIPRERDALAALGLEEIQYGNWAKSECFKVEKGLLSFGWGRWPEILELGQFKRGWRDIDIEDCARIILLYCLQVYKGDEKIKNFIWDLITPTEDGEVQKISRDHSGLHNLVPRGRNAKGRNGGKTQKETSTSSTMSSKCGGIGENDKDVGLLDPNHWSKQDKYDADAFLEGAYKKHLSRHANKVLLRVRMLYYIQHEVIGDLVQQIKDNTLVSELPIRPPATPDQVPASWWNPVCCDKSLLVGTYKHGCEMYRQIRADPTLCFVGHVGAGDDIAVTNLPINEEDGNSKHDDNDDVDDDGTTTKDSDSTKLTAGDNKDSLDPERPSSSGKSNNNKREKQTTAVAAKTAVADDVEGVGCGDDMVEAKNVAIDGKAIDDDTVKANTNTENIIDKKGNAMDVDADNENDEKESQNEAANEKQENNSDDVGDDKQLANEAQMEVDATEAADDDHRDDNDEHENVAKAKVCETQDLETIDDDKEINAEVTTSDAADVAEISCADSNSNDATTSSPSAFNSATTTAPTTPASGGNAIDGQPNTTTNTITSSTTTTAVASTADVTPTITENTTASKANDVDAINTASTGELSTNTNDSATADAAAVVVAATTNGSSTEQSQNADAPNSNSCLGLDEEESGAGSYPPTNLPPDELNATTMWPSMQDLNTRLRRVITAYQRNYKKEELKQQQKAKLQALVSSTPPLSVPTTPTLQSMQMQMQNAAAAGGGVASGAGAGPNAGVGASVGGDASGQLTTNVGPNSQMTMQQHQQQQQQQAQQMQIDGNRQMQTLLQNQNNQTLSTGASTSAAAAAAAAAASSTLTSAGGGLHQQQQNQLLTTSQQQQQSQTQQQQQQQPAAAVPSAVQFPTAADIGLMLNFLNTTDVSQLANLDLNKLAMYLKMERQGKMEIAAKERESQRLQSIPKKWNRREEYEFLRVLTGYGIDLQPISALMTCSNAPVPDWTKFKQMAHLERKSDETLSDYYKVFIAMCKRQAGVKLNENERGLEGIIEDISEDHAKLILDRLELLSKLREIAKHPHLEKRLKLCMKNADTPDWWEPGRHDKELVAAVLKYGLYRSETFIFNDQTFSFAESEKRFIRELEAQIQRTIKLEALNTEKAAAEAASAVKNEIIDLDDELLTKSSLIKKEHYVPTSAAASTVKEENSKIENTIKEKTPTIEQNQNNEAKVVEDKKTPTKEAASIEDLTASEENDDNKEKTSTDENKVEDKANAAELEKGDSSDEVSETPKVEETPSKVNKTNNEMETDGDDVKITEIDETEKEVATESKEKDDIKNSEETADTNAKSDESKDEDKTNNKTEQMQLDTEAPEVIATDADENNSESKIVEKAVEKEVAEITDEQTKETEETENVNKEIETAEISATESRNKADDSVNENALDKESTDAEEVKVLKTAVTKDKDDLLQKQKDADAAALDLASAGAATSTADPDDDEVMKEKEKAVEEECKKQAAELKARFPDLEVIQPASVKQKFEKPKLEMCMIRWFKDFALERRVAHIVTCVETNKWPVDVSYSAFAGCKGLDLNIGLHEAIPHLNAIERRSTTPDVITITTDQGITKHLPASQMHQVAGAAAASAAKGANVGGSGNIGTGNTGLVGLDANSINAAVAAAVAAVASGGGGSSSAQANSLANLLPGTSMTTAGAPSGNLSGLNTPIHTPNANSAAATSVAAAIGTPTTPTAGKKRKRHIAIDVETERAKLHALLNSSQGMGPKDWETEIANMEALSAATAGPAGRRSANSAVSPAAAAAAAASSLANLQPPPAHQHGLSRQNPSQFNKPSLPPLKTPPPSMGAPMDLSSTLPKMNMTDMLKSASNIGAIDLSEVQDFSMSSKKANSSSVHAALSSAFPSMGSKSKLDDTLSKLMKKNNCTIEEPVIGKEKKRKKLDEIVLGLSAAKELKTFPDPSLPSSKKPQIPPSVSVTPANVPSSMSSQNQANQKPFTITVTTVPGKSKSNSSNINNMSSPSTSGGAGSSGLSALQSMTMGGGSGAGNSGLSSKDSLNALLAQTMSSDPQTFLKQQQKMIQCLPPAQRKIYENMLAEMEQAIKMSAKYSTHDSGKVNKWLSDMGAPLSDQLSMEYIGGASNNSSNRRSSRQSNSSQMQQQQQQQQQQASASQMSKSSSQSAQMHQQSSAAVGPQGLTGDEPVPVINKQTGKRLTGNKAPQLKRLMQWLTENPQYEVDPKWLDQMQNPMPAPSPKPVGMDSSYGSSSKSHGGRPSSASSNASSSGGSHMQQQSQSSSTQQSSASASSSSKKSARQNAIDQANAAMQFGSLAGLNPSLLASLPGLGAFDPKNPLAAFDPKNALAGIDPKNPLAAFSMPFPGMPGMGSIPGLGNLNNMNLFASLAGMGGLGNLAGMDPQSLAALMAAAGPALTGLGTTGTGGGGGASSSGKSSQASSSQSKKNKQNADAAAQLAAANAAILASAAGAGGSGGSGSGSSSSKNAAASASAAQLAAGLPFLFPNTSLLYPPMGLGGLNPYSLGSTGLGSAYDQLAQQYNLLNGGGANVSSSAGSSSTTQSKSHQSQSKSNSSRSATNTSSSSSAAANLMNAMASMSGSHGAGGGSAGNSNNQSSSQSSSSSSRVRQSAASRAQAQASAEMAQLSNLLMPGADPHLLESLSRMAGMDLAQATRLMSSLGLPPLTGTSSASDKRSSSNNSAAAAAAAAQAAQEKQAAKEQQKWMENLARGMLPTDLATLQAFSQGKLPSSLTGGSGGSGSGSSNTGNSGSGSSSSSSKNAAKAAAAAAAAAAQMPQIPGMPPDLSQAFFAEMAAQAMTGSMSSLASLAGLTGPQGTSGGNSGGGGGSNLSANTSSSKRQREQDALAKDAFKQQMDYYTKALGLGSGISLIPTSMSSSSGSASSLSASMSALDEHQHSHKSKRSRMDAAAQAAASLKADEMTAAALVAAGLPLNIGGGMTSIEKSLRSSSNSNTSATMHPPLSSAGATEVDKVTLTPLTSASIAANLPSQTTITIAPPISSGASSSSERSERSESRISLTITNAAEAAKLPPPYEEADELIIQPILKKTPTSSSSTSATTPSSSITTSATTEQVSSAPTTTSATAASATSLNNIGDGNGPTTDAEDTHSDADGAAASTASASVSNASNSGLQMTSSGSNTAADSEHRRSSTRLKRPRSGADHSLANEQPPEKRRELRSTRHTRQSSGNPDSSLNLSTSEGDEKAE